MIAPYNEKATLYGACCFYSKISKTRSTDADPIASKIIYVNSIQNRLFFFVYFYVIDNKKSKLYNHIGCNRITENVKEDLKHYFKSNNS